MKTIKLKHSLLTATALVFALFFTSCSNENPNPPSKDINVSVSQPTMLGLANALRQVTEIKKDGNSAHLDWSSEMLVHLDKSHPEFNDLNKAGESLLNVLNRNNLNVSALNLHFAQNTNIEWLKALHSIANRDRLNTGIRDRLRTGDGNEGGNDTPYTTGHLSGENNTYFAVSSISNMDATLIYSMMRQAHEESTCRESTFHILADTFYLTGNYGLLHEHIPGFTDGDLLNLIRAYVADVNRDRLIMNGISLTNSMTKYFERYGHVTNITGEYLQNANLYSYDFNFFQNHLSTPQTPAETPIKITDQMFMLDRLYMRPGESVRYYGPEINRALEFKDHLRRNISLIPHLDPNEIDAPRIPLDISSAPDSIVNGRSVKVLDVNNLVKTLVAFRSAIPYRLTHDAFVEIPELPPGIAFELAGVITSDVISVTRQLFVSMRLETGAFNEQMGLPVNTNIRQINFRVVPGMEWSPEIIELMRRYFISSGLIR